MNRLRKSGVPEDDAEEQMTPQDSQGHVVVIMYTNYRGEQAARRIVPERIWFGGTDWHPEPQWLLDGFDLGRKAVRSFAMKDIASFVADTTPGVSDGSPDQEPSDRVRIFG